MSHSINQQLSTLESKVPIKNLHTVRDLQIYNNKQIFIIYDSSIHIHSMSKMIATLPSLVYVIQLIPIALKIQSQNYQDKLTKRILRENKSNFGEIIFTQELNADKNLLVSVSHFKQRLKFLSSQFIKTKNVRIHSYGHLLIDFEDGRSILIKRTNPLSINQNYQNLYKIQEPLLINNILKSTINLSIFVSYQDISFICLHTTPQKQNSSSVLSKIALNEKGVPLVVGFTAKKPNLHSKGCMGIQYVKIKQSEWIILVYYSRLQIIEFDKSHNKNKNLQIISHKQADFSQQLSGQHIIRIWKYSQFDKQQQKCIKFYLLTSSSIWQMLINFKLDNKQQISWNYTINKMKDQQIQTKSNIFYINFKGDYLFHKLQKNDHPNFILNLCTQTNNGIMVRLQGRNDNYKQGWLYIAYQNATYTVDRIMRNLKQKLAGDKGWVSFSDLNCLQKSSTLKKQILKILTQMNKNSKKQDNFDEDNESALLNRLIINVLTIFKSKPEIVQNLTSKIISHYLKIPSRQTYQSNCCFLTNKKITIQEVLLCNRCYLYCIKSSNSPICCYICWNPLYSIN